MNVAISIDGVTVAGRRSGGDLGRRVAAALGGTPWSRYRFISDRQPIAWSSHTSFGAFPRNCLRRGCRLFCILLLLSACGSRQTPPAQSDGGDLLPDGCPGICNAVTPSYPSVEVNGGTGNVTMYSTAPSSGGACNYGATNVLYYAAMSVNVQPGDGDGQWQGGRICGQCVNVTALTAQGPQSVVVRIMDKCPDGFCGIDLGGLAPAAIMLDGSGRYDGTWTFVSCKGHPEVSDGVPSLFVLAGSNAFWSRVQVRNPPAAVASIAWQDVAGAAQGSFPYASDPENSFEVPTAALQSTAAEISIAVTYTDGSSAMVQVAPAELAAPNTAYPLVGP